MGFASRSLTCGGSAGRTGIKRGDLSRSILDDSDHYQGVVIHALFVGLVIQW
jgi:hypothetical protein